MLRPYQEQIKKEIEDHWSKGSKNVLAVSPTGSGKTVLFGEIIQNHVGKSAAIAHRKELVSQISLQLTRQDLPHRIIAPKNVIASIVRQHREECGLSYFSPTANASVAGIDTLVSRQDKLAEWSQQISLWTIDEAHHVLLNNKWGIAAKLFSNARGLGVTATPKRADNKGLGIHSEGVFYSMVLGPSMRDLIDMGYLTDYEIVIPKSDFDRDLLQVGSTGDFTHDSMKKASKQSKIVGDIVQSYINYACEKRTIIFVTDVESSNELAERFNAFGIPAASVSAETDDSTRDKAIRDFRSGALKVLVNVDLFGEGFDVPAVEVIIMARPTKSLAVYLQQFGRALRLLEGKKRALVIDLVSNVINNGFPDKMRHWSLDGKETKPREKDPDDVPITTCTHCFRPYEIIHRSCPHCGNEPDDSTGGKRTIEQVDGDLILLDSETLAALRKSIVLESPGSMAERVAMVAGEIAGRGAASKQKERLESQQALSNMIALWAGHQRVLNRPDHESYRRFYHWIGVDVLTALTLPKNEMNQIREKIERNIG